MWAMGIDHYYIIEKFNPKKMCILQPIKQTNQEVLLNLEFIFEVNCDIIHMFWAHYSV